MNIMRGWAALEHDPPDISRLGKRTERESPEMKEPEKGNMPKVDRRGTTILVPLGISVVLIVIAGLMLMRDSGDAPPVPTPSGGAVTQPSTGNK